MARTVDPVRHGAKRLRIIDAALTCFARDGYDRATTAAICREAGIGSGTFFHYFPTKLGVLLAVLETGVQETTDRFEQLTDRSDAWQVVEDYVTDTARELSDPRLAGFVRAISSVLSQPEVAAVLDRDTEATRKGLLPWVAAAADAGQVRTDLAPERVVAWIQALLDGYVGMAATSPSFDPEAEVPVLLDAVRRLVRADT